MPHRGDGRRNLEYLGNHLHVLMPVHVVDVDAAQVELPGLGVASSAAIWATASAPLPGAGQAIETEEAATKMSPPVDQQRHLGRRQNRFAAGQTQMDADSQPRVLVDHVIERVLKGRHIGHQAGAGDDPFPKRLSNGEVRGSGDAEIIGVDDDILGHVVFPSLTEKARVYIAALPVQGNTNIVAAQSPRNSRHTWRMRCTASSISAAVVVAPKLKRSDEPTIDLGSPIAKRVGDSSVEPLEQAEPTEHAMPDKSKAISST